MVTSHFELQRLSPDDNERQTAYRELFNPALSEAQLSEIRNATNKAWALVDSCFKEKVQLQLARRVEPAAGSGDRKSAQFKAR